MELPLSVIFTNKLNPSEDFSPRRCATTAQNSLARVLESTSKAWKEQKARIIRITKTNEYSQQGNILNVELPDHCHLESTLCGISESFCAEKRNRSVMTHSKIMWKTNGRSRKRVLEQPQQGWNKQSHRNYYI